MVQDGLMDMETYVALNIALSKTLTADSRWTVELARQGYIHAFGMVRDAP